MATRAMPIDAKSVVVTVLLIVVLTVLRVFILQCGDGELKAEIVAVLLIVQC